jgi:hypothetical protein
MKHLFCLLFVFTALCSTAQQVTYSDYQKFDLRSGDYSVIGRVGERLYTYRSTSDGYFLDEWNDSMGRTATVILDFFPAKIYDTRFIAYADKIIVLYQGSERGHITQYAALLDDKGRLQGKVRKLDDAKTGIFGPSGNYFSSAVSEDKKYIVVYSTEAKGDNIHITHTILDDNLVTVQRSVSNYRGGDDLTAQPGLIDNNGVFYLPVITTKGNRDYADGIWLLTLPKGTAKLIATEIPLGGKYGSGLYFRMDNTAHRIYAAGFYSEKKAGNYEGILFSQFNADSVSAVTTRRLPLDDRIREASGERSKRRAFNDYQTRQLIIRNDGGFVLVAEDFYMSVRNTAAPYGYYTSYYSPFSIGNQNIREYRYGDILTLSYDAEGKREWNAYVRKDQYSQEDGGAFSSYAFINTGGSLGFLYNDYDSRRSRIQLGTINDEGKVAFHPLDTGSDTDPDWLPRAGRQVSAHELIVPCLHRRQICFAKVVF